MPDGLSTVGHVSWRSGTWLSRQVGQSGWCSSLKIKLVCVLAMAGSLR